MLTLAYALIQGLIVRCGGIGIEQVVNALVLIAAQESVHDAVGGFVTLLDTKHRGMLLSVGLRVVIELANASWRGKWREGGRRNRAIRVATRVLVGNLHLRECL